MAHLPKGKCVLPLPPFKAWLASNIPAVYDNTLTYYEELCALIKYLQSVILPALNENAAAITAVSTAVERLQKYVEDYFKNLDVQEEINNKLDEMAENGTLEEIITAYIQANVAWEFSTVEDMQGATNLIAGSYAKTLGRFTVNDGGAGLYEIKDATGVTPNGMDEISINDSIYAKLVVENDTISIRQLGGKSYQDNSNTIFDNHDYIERFLAIKAELGRFLTLYIPSGRWHTSPIQINTNSFKILGNESFSFIGNTPSEFAPVRDNQAYLIKIGGYSDFSVDTIAETSDVAIENINFTAQYDSNTTHWYHIEKGALCLDYCLYSFFDKIFFNKIDGTCLYIRSCWEDYFGIVNCRVITNPAYPCIHFDSIAAYISGANISALDFENLMFEGIDGTMIKSEDNSSLTHCNFNNINIEYTTGTRDSRRQEMTSGEDVSTYKEMAMFDGMAEYLTFNNVNFYTQYDFKLVFPEGTYYLAALFRTAHDEITEQFMYSHQITVNSVIFKTFTDCHTRVCRQKNSSGTLTEVLIGNLLYPGNSPINLMNFENGSTVKVANLQNGDRSPKFIPIAFNECAMTINNRGVLTTDLNASNPLKLVYKKPSIGMNGQSMYVQDASFMYPYNKEDTIKLRVNLKAESGATINLIVRGTLNGASKDYTITGTGDGSYHIFEKDIAFDANTQVNFVESLASANCYLDYFSLS